jgi:hypothetical protein
LTGPFKVTDRLSDLSYEISMNHKKQVVHTNRLKKAYNPEIWKPKPDPEIPRNRSDKRINRPQEPEDEIQLGTPLAKNTRWQRDLNLRNRRTRTWTRLNRPHGDSERKYPSYEPSQYAAV